MKSKKSVFGANWKIFAGIGAVLLLILIYFTFSDSDFTGSKVKSKKNMMSKTSDPTKKGTGSDNLGGTEYSEVMEDDGATPEILLDHYKEWAKYPPNSRPLAIENYDLVYPFKVDNSPTIMFDSPSAKEPNGYRCLMQPRTWAAIGGQEMFITLECRDSTSTPVKIQVESYNVFKEWEGKQYPTHSPDVNDDGRDGDDVAKDNIFTFRWRPMQADWGQMSLETNILYGRESKKAKVSASFYSSPNKPAQFSNFFRDMVIDGSLVIKAEIKVVKPGNYHLEANLKEAEGGNYVAYATYDGQLKGGTNEVDFLFFGKVLRDKGYDGPYIFTAGRGHRVNLPIDPAWFTQGEEGLRKIQAAKTTEPDRELVVPYTEEYKTKAYTISSFSKAEWQSEEKTKRIQELQNLNK
ncbi:MAG: hypothetical protein L6Q54_09410 [Leptospiraceae bacterium]|nr:hypothetical protein [Leptospiraceae bacterium]MCK6381446.1 hypothetical protein [Leptospiraceae bacterium]NUM41830.1 hypothetical protein [Leptospiraceae bacterium]